MWVLEERRFGWAEGQWSAGTNIPENLPIHLPPEHQPHEGQGLAFCFFHLELNICGVPE